MENLIGRKVRGFKFDEGYAELMDDHIGEIGEITDFKNDWITVKFKGTYWLYPPSQIKEHLFDEVPTLEEVLNTPDHYNNEYGSLCLFSERQGLNSWEFEAIKRIVRCRKKGEWESDIKKTIDSLNLYKEEQGHLYKGQIEPKNK